MDSRTERQHTNRLIHSTSPYLLQHAYNPVDWFPWSAEALNHARVDDKPIFLSIGYSACHWCHVMERESFENPETAAIMNEHFINIKVDREERPDLDEIYMSAVQAMTGQGGWPMSVFLTPDLKPFYGGTYFPPTDMYGRPGFRNILSAIADTYRRQRVEILEGAEKLAGYIQDMMTVQSHQTNVDISFIDHCVEEMRARFDSQHGGFGGAPKFPHSMDISLLLRHAKRTHDDRALSMAVFSLEKMARGGMYDQVGGGFHRYSTDARWLIPHFEKMLYDNALLAKTYTEAFQFTHQPFFEKIVHETLDYVLREMTSPEGIFYSSQDADSEGKEGIFFAWTPKQIAEAVGNDTANVIRRYFGVNETGNFEHGTSVLHVPLDEETLCDLFHLSPAQLRQMIQEAKDQLFQIRETRVKPGRDEKSLTDWNGLMISAMAFAGNVFSEDRYRQAAETACEFLLNHLFQGNRLLHTYKDGHSHINGFLSDYSFFINGLLDTYEASQNPHWLESALQLSRFMLERFYDPDQGAFFFTSNDHEILIARSKNPMDNAVPSGNSMAILALLRLSEITGEREFRRKAEESLSVFAANLQRMPSAYPQMLCALDFLLSSPQEVVLAANDINGFNEMRQVLFSHFYPNKVVLYHHPESAETLARCTSLHARKTPVDNHPTAYVCQNFTCQKPITDRDALRQSMNENGGTSILENHTEPK